MSDAILGSVSPSLVFSPSCCRILEAMATGTSVKRGEAAGGGPEASPRNLQPWSGARFEYEIEGSLRGAPELGEAAILDHGAQAAFARLCAQAQADFL